MKKATFRAGSSKGHRGTWPASSRGSCRRLGASFGLLFAILVAASLAGAESKPASDANPDELSRRGTAQFEARDYESARLSFSRAHEIRPTPQTLLDLAVAEVNAKHLLDGIRHLRAYVQMADVPPEQAASVREALLRKAYTKVTRVFVNLPEGTSVRLDDGSEVVRNGDDDSIVVLPGTHRVRTLDGRNAEFTAEAGGQVHLTISAPARPAAGSPSRIAASPAVAAISATQAGGLPSVDRGPPARFWNTRTTVLAIGAGLAVAGLGAGAFFLARGAHDQERVDSLREDIRTQFGTSNACLDGRVGAESSTCSQLSDTARTKADEQNLATAAFVTGGVLGLATIAGVLFWPRAHGSAPPGVVVSAVARPNIVGISLTRAY